MSFDALAPHYRWMECALAGNKLQSCRTAFLDRVAHCQNVLIMGGGNGRFLLECRRRLKDARIISLDVSARMLALSQERLENHGVQLSTVEFVQADALVWRPPTRAFDLIVTHFFLDCFRPDQLKRIVAALSNAAKADASWLLADFQVPSGGWRRYRALLIHRAMYLFFRLATRLSARALTPPDDLIKAQRFSLRARRQVEWGLLHTDIWERTNLEGKD